MKTWVFSVHNVLCPPAAGCTTASMRAMLTNVSNKGGKVIIWTGGDYVPEWARELADLVCHKPDLPPGDVREMCFVDSDEYILRAVLRMGASGTILASSLSVCPVEFTG